MDGRSETSPDVPVAICSGVRSLPRYGHRIWRKEEPVMMLRATYCALACDRSRSNVRGE